MRPSSGVSKDGSYGRKSPTACWAFPERSTCGQIGEYLTHVGTFHLHPGRSGYGAYRLQSRSRGNFAFEDHDTQRRACHVSHPEPETIPGASRTRGMAFPLDVVHVC
jgi:hypothetical protein